jgi:hypothetical protein
VFPEKTATPITPRYTIKRVQESDMKIRKPQSTNRKAVANKLRKSFDKKLATFLKEAATPEDNEESRRELLKKLRASESLNKAGREYAHALRKEYDQLAKQDKLEVLKFSDIPRPSRPTLRGLAKRMGTSPKQLAEKIGIDAAIINRVLKKPDWSKPTTVKRILVVLGGEL